MMPEKNGFFLSSTLSWGRRALLLALSPTLLLIPLAWRYGTALKILWDSVKALDLGNAVAAVIAVGGYALDNWNARQQHQHEAMMERVLDQSHKFLIPITEQFHSLWLGSLCFFVDGHIEEYYPKNDKLGESANLAAAVQDFYLKLPFLAVPTGLRNPASLALLAMDMMGVPETCLETIPVDLSCLMKRQSATLIPRELPSFLHDAVERCEKPSSSLWMEYETFIRHELVPAVDKIADIINENGDLMEPVPPQSLSTMFGPGGTEYGQPWPCAPRMWFYAIWIAYARSWSSVLAQWDDGHYNLMRPRCHFPIGLLRFNVEAQKIVDDVEKRLVGVSQMHGHAST